MKRVVPLIVLLPLTAYGFLISGETGGYSVKLKGNYKRQFGFERWKGKKEGYYYRLDLKESFHLGKSADFFLSVTTGSTKVPYESILTSERDKLFYGGFKTFNIKELYLIKRGFIWRKLTLKAGKQEFRIPGLIKDYLWGGSFIYQLNKNFSIYWNQIAGYEGKYLLFSGDEDDVDISQFGVNWKGLNLGFYRIMDAKGNLSGISKGGVYGEYSKKGFKTSLFSQNGKWGGISRLDLNGIEIKAGYSQRGTTSYGYGEDLGNLGLIFKPSFSGVRFLSLSFSPYRFLRVNLSRFEKPSGRQIGNEVGGELRYPFYKGELFLRGAVGSHNSYALFGGYRWGINNLEKFSPANFSIKNYFSISGEYSDLPRRRYRPQIDFDGWDKAKHVGYWHTTYKLSLKSENLRFKVSTGRNTKVDYVVWGNTSDNFLYQKSHRKLWHLEELNYSFRNFRLGLQPFEIKGVMKDYLWGILYETSGLRAGTLYHKEKSRLGIYTLSYKNLSYVLFSNGCRSNSLLSLYLKAFGLTASLSKEWGKGQSREWGVLLETKRKFFSNDLTVRYRVHSKKFSTYRVREYYRDDGLMVRPSEGDERYLKVLVERPLNYKFSPKLGFIYNRLYRFSGDFVSQEFGFSISFKPCRRGTFSLLGALGTNSSYYEGIKFSVSW